MAKVSDKQKGYPRVLTTEEVDGLIKRVKVGLKQRMPDMRKEEPGLSERARHFVIRY